MGGKNRSNRGGRRWKTKKKQQQQRIIPRSQPGISWNRYRKLLVLGDGDFRSGMDRRTVLDPPPTLSLLPCPTCLLRGFGLPLYPFVLLSFFFPFGIKIFVPRRDRYCLGHHDFLMILLSCALLSPESGLFSILLLLRR